MDKPFSLKPLDVAVALRIAAAPEATYQALAHDLMASTSTIHQAVKRLEAAQLLIPGSRRVNRLALREFLEHGVRYAFPGVLGAQAQGVPTAHAAPPLASLIAPGDPVVWPAARGPGRGARLAPLLPRAAELPQRCPPLYRALTLVDALRVGRARERKLAAELLAEELGPAAAAA